MLATFIRVVDERLRTTIERFEQEQETLRRAAGALHGEMGAERRTREGDVGRIGKRLGDFAVRGLRLQAGSVGLIVVGLTMNSLLRSSEVQQRSATSYELCAWGISTRCAGAWIPSAPMVVAASDGFTQWLMDPEANVDAAMELEALINLRSKQPIWMRLERRSP